MTQGYRIRMFLS